jgi:hypothetical protein
MPYEARDASGVIARLFMRSFYGEVN